MIFFCWIVFEEPEWFTFGPSSQFETMELMTSPERKFQQIRANLPRQLR